MPTVYVPGRFWGEVDTFRQTPNGKGRFRSCRFHNDKNQNSDYILMAEDNYDWHSFPKNKRILVVMENPSIWHQPNEILEAAGILISPFQHKLLGNDTVNIKSHPAIPWFYGINFETNCGLLHKPLNSACNLTELALTDMPNKLKLISCICSSKNLIPGHQWRINLTNGLKKYFGDDCDVFGFGHKPIANKAEAIDPYKFSLVIENEASEDYWTEKLSDALLGYSSPIYSGASKAQSYFDEDLLTIPYGIEIDKAILLIKQIIDRSDDSRLVKSVTLNRNKILFEHNLYSILERVISRISGS